jgi:hypothetical protein
MAWMQLEFNIISLNLIEIKQYQNIRTYFQTQQTICKLRFYYNLRGLSTDDFGGSVGIKLTMYNANGRESNRFAHGFAPDF